MERALPNLVHGQFAQKRNIPKGAGKSIEFRKFTSLAAATTALTEGTPPSGSNLSMTAVTVTISQYGDYIRGSDLVETQAIDNVLAETAELMGELFAQGKPLKFGESLSETTASQARYSYREGVETRRGALRPIGRSEGRVRTAWRHAEAAEMTARLGTLKTQFVAHTRENMRIQTGDKALDVFPLED